MKNCPLGARYVKFDTGVKHIGSCFIMNCTLFWIKPARFFFINTCFLYSNVNLEAVASLCAILYSFAVVFVYIGLPFAMKK